MQALAPNLNNGITQSNWGQANDGTPNQGDPNAGAVNWFQPGGLAYQLGLRNPGSPAARDFFNHETTPEQNTRMELVGKGIEGVGKAFMGAIMPAPIGMALNAYKTYQNYQNDPNKDLGKAFADALSGSGGYTGALANMYNGNYGSAVTSALGKTPGANIAGIGTDYLTGKNVAPSIGGLVGQSIGNQFGGTLGGMFGQSLGKQIGQNNVVRK
jgi:hypothetical protein